MNLISKLIEHKNSRPKKLAVQYFKRGNLFELNWEQVYDRIAHLHFALESFGIQKGDSIVIYSDTCKDWGLVDMAIMACGGVTVPIYHSAHLEDISFILNETQPRVLFVQNERLSRNLKDIPGFEKIEYIVSFETFDPFPENFKLLKDLYENIRAEDRLKEAAKEIKLDDLATIIFTSGTSGRPKGACLLHRQIMSATADVFPLLGVTHLDKTLTFLPLSHVLGRIELWGHYFCGYTLGYAESIDKIKRNILEVQPTVIVGVPRIFEKIFFGIKAQVEISKLKQGIFNRALKIGSTIARLRRKKKSPSFLQAIEAQLAYQLVFSSIQEKLGGRIRFAISGGAPLDPAIAGVFAACNIPVLEGYGLTETTGPIFVNTLFDHQMGTVGKAVGDVDLKFAKDQEILVKSDKVFSHYLNDEESTKEAFTEDGYFKTGDIGELDDEGFLKITDRKKDLIKTAGGKFVAPQKIQNLFAVEPLISHVHVHGDKKKYIVALITLDKDRVFQLKEKHDISSSDFEQLTQSDLIKMETRKAVAKVNAGLPSFETIKRFDILDHDFSIEGGQLTPSMKMKRKVIDEIYQENIEKLYQ